MKRHWWLKFNGCVKFLHHCKKLPINVILAMGLLPAFGWAQAGCSSFYAAGASLNKQATPNVQGWLAISTPITKCGSTQPLYSITMHSIQFLKGGNFQDTTTTGIAFPVRTFGPVTVYFCGTAGVAVANNTAQGAYSGCAVATAPLVPAWHLMVTPWFQILKGVSNTSTTYGLGVGRAF